MKKIGYTWPMIGKLATSLQRPDADCRHPETVDPARGVGEALRRCGIVPTRQRKRIAALLLPYPRHMTANEVCREVNWQSPPISKATVYNTLNLFARKGLLSQVAIGRGRTFYDSNTAPHCHLYDEDTDSLTDFHGEQPPLEQLPPLPKGTAVCGVDMVVRISRQCAKRKAHS